MRFLVVLSLVSLLFAGCASVPVDPTEVLQEAPGLLEEYTRDLPAEQCFTFHNIPFTDVGWPDKYLPPGYLSADASTVWGMPVNLQFSALGIGIFHCEGPEPWTMGFLHVLIDPPQVDGLTPIQPTSNPSPFTAVDGGFNMYAVEVYATGDIYDDLKARGWNVFDVDIDFTIPAETARVPGHGQGGHFLLGATDGFWYTAGEIEVIIEDTDGERSRFDNQLEIIWNHRNFEFQVWHDTPDGTGRLEFTVGSDHLLVGRGTCTHRDDTLAHEMFTEMEYLFPDGAERPRSTDCPDDGLGAYWQNFNSPLAQLRHIPGVWAQ